MWVLPLAAALIALVFASLLVKQFAARRQPFQILWTAALAMYAAASFAVFLGVVSGWSAAAYRTYWLFGAVLNVPYLAVGEFHLLAKSRRLKGLVTCALVLVSAFALVAVLRANVTASALSSDLPSSKCAWSTEPTMRLLASVCSYLAYAYLLVGTAWSAWRMRGASHLRNRFLGTLGIAVGATIVAAGSAFAVKGIAAGFSLTLAAGVAVMFWGFLRASKPGASPPLGNQG